MDTVSLQAALDAGIAHHEAGRFVEAEALYRRVLQQDPDELDALNLCGVLLQDRGAITESIALLSRACALDPTFSEALTNLARAQNAAGDAATAAGNARQAIAHDPELAAAHLQLGRALLALHDDTAALEACRRAVALEPTQHDTQSHLGIALSRAKDYPGAALAFRAALRHDPGRFETQLGLGGVLTELGELPEALRALRAAVALAPDDVRGHAALALALHRAEDMPGAIAACGRALELAPERGDLWGQQGENYAVVGRFDEAAACFRRTLALDPGAPEAQLALARMGRLERTDREIDELRGVLRDAAQQAKDRIAAGFALGTTLDRVQDYDDAFAAYDTANRLVRDSLSAAGMLPDLGQFADQISALIAAYNPAAFAATREWGDPSELPVFVVGMPRSGTTLVEQIAASHPRVHGVGERKDLLMIADRLTAGKAGHRPAAWDKAAVRQAAAEQLDRLRGLGGGADRIVDKMPDNVLLLGLVAVLFPNARVVICRRDPRDVGLSCFFQQFGDGMAWTYDLAMCGARAREIDRLTTHWLATLPLRIHEVQYEALVGDLEAESRRLIDFLGLDWDPACLAFHRTERAVLSASRWQVRQPLYATSVGRWRSYRHHLAPLIAALGPLVPQEEAAPPAPSPEVDALFRQGRALLERNDAAGATEVLRQAVVLAPELADLHHYLAMALMRRSDHAAAAAALRTALDLRPDWAEVCSKLGWTLSQIGRREEALACHRHAVALAPLDPRVRLGMVLFHFQAHDVPAMAEAALEAVALLPGDPELWLHLGHAQAALGQFDAAAASYRRVLAIDPGRQDAQASLVSIGERADTLATAELRRAVLADPSRPRLERTAAGFALGTALDHVGEYDAAFAAFAEANSLARAEHRASGRTFDATAFERGIDARIATFTSGAFMAMAGRGHPSEVPVFVVGMPRSGTTLVEQIAASHPRVFGAGELNDIGTLIATLEAGQTYRPPTGWDQARTQREVAAYLAKLGGLGGTADRVVDKMPGNLLNLGQIAMLLPNARIVVCQRDLRDVCLSCFMQEFAEPLPWTTDLTDLATFARGNARLLAHWKSVLPSRLLVMPYEALVGDLEGQSRRLIDFLGLDWDPACLDFHRTRRAVMTASLWQVRQPIYNTSVGRWRHYAQHLAPLLAGLAGFVPPSPL